MNANSASLIYLLALRVAPSRQESIPRMWYSSLQTQLVPRGAHELLLGDSHLHVLQITGHGPLEYNSVLACFGSRESILTTCYTKSGLAQQSRLPNSDKRLPHPSVLVLDCRGFFSKTSRWSIDTVT